jgi:hypothetical protein
VHVDTRWIAALKQEAAAERVPIMEIVDRAFRQYFEGGKHGSTVVDIAAAYLSPSQGLQAVLWKMMNDRRLSTP